MELEFVNYRRLGQQAPSSWSDAELAQIDAITAQESFQHFRGIHREKYEDQVEGLDDDLEDWEYHNAEVVDVATTSGEVMFQLHVFGYGSAYLVEHNTDDHVGGAQDHNFEMDDDEWLEAMAKAYAGGKIQQEMSFE